MALTASGITDDVSERLKCQKCKAAKPLSAFPIVKQGKNKGKPGGTCEPCQKKKKEAKARSQRDAETENLVDPSKNSSQGNGVSLDEVELTYFLSFLREQDDAVSLEVTVNILELQGSIREKADTLSKLVWEMMNYRFVYVLNLISTRSMSYLMSDRRCYM
jgi:hypothetical protein